MKIYDMNSVDWVCANSLEEAKEVYTRYLKDTYGEDSVDFNEIVKDADPVEITEEQLDKLIYSDEDENYQPVKRTFKEELARRTRSEFFASTEF